MKSTLDLQGIAERADLLAIIESHLGPPKIIGGKPRWPCPWHPDSNPSLYLWAEGRRWRCWPCGVEGDVLDFVAKLEGISVAEAAAKISGQPRGPRQGRGKARRSDRGRGAIARTSSATKTAPRADRTPSSASGVAWRDPEWQGTVDDLVNKAEEHLWSPSGRAALDWLRGRGLAEDTIARFRLGYQPAPVESSPLATLPARPDGRPRGIVCARGITLPWVRPGSWYCSTPDPDGADPGPRWVGCNVRRLAPDPFAPLDRGPKCLALAGSSRGYAYPWTDVMPGVEAMLVEGELDALLAFQEVGHLVNVVTVGGATQEPHTSAWSALAACPRWLVMTDHDAEGDRAARRFAEAAPRKAARGWLPHGKDVGEFVQAGGCLRQWLAGEFTRLGWPKPLS